MARFRKIGPDEMYPPTIRQRILRFLGHGNPMQKSTLYRMPGEPVSRNSLDLALHRLIQTGTLRISYEPKGKFRGRIPIVLQRVR